MNDRELVAQTIAEIKPIDPLITEKAQARLDILTKPQGSLGRLEEVAKRMAGITGTLSPALEHKTIITAAADHGVTNAGVSAFPQAVTAQMVYNFLAGGAGINVLARHIGARVVVVDAGVAAKINAGAISAKNCRFAEHKVGPGTKNFATEPAMTKEEAFRSLAAGIAVVLEEKERGLDLLGTGDMGIGNTASSSAIVAAITGAPVESVTGRGTGIDDKALANKIKLLKEALALHKPNPKDGLDVLRTVGGFEIGVLAGVYLAGAALRIPVVIDGFISGAAALIACTLEPKAKEYMIPSHCSVEQGHKITLDFIGLKPLFNFDMRLGEGTGATLGMNIIEASVKIMKEMATFHEAGVSEKN